MAKREPKNKRLIVNEYMEHILNEGKEPGSVYAFMKKLDLKESDFYKYFGSFEGVNSYVFQSFFNNTIELLSKDDSYPEFEAQDKLLSFYFTFFEILTANRSYVRQVLDNRGNMKMTFSVLSDLRKDYLEYLQKIDLPTADLKIEKIQEFADKSQHELAWNQMLVTLKFWLDDKSPNFEKTDIFIEKSIKTGFSLMNTEPLNNLLDLGKFLFKETAGIKV